MCSSNNQGYHYSDEIFISLREDFEKPFSLHDDHGDYLLVK